MLGRTITMESTIGRIVQTCPACGAQLGLNAPQLEGAALRRALFRFYDEHRCTPETVALFEAAERELVRAMERTLAIEDPELRARAEVEADRMASLADRLRKRFAT